MSQGMLKNGGMDVIIIVFITLASFFAVILLPLAMFLWMRKKDKPPKGWGD